MNRLEAPLVCSLLLVVCAGCAVEATEETESVANDITVCSPSVMPLPDPCASHVSDVADATLEMNANVTEDHIGVAPPPPAQYPLTTFGNCPANVVDVLIPSTSSPDPADCTNGCYPTVEMAAGAGTFDGSKTDPDSDYFKLPNTENSCESFSLWARLYAKLAGESTFTLKKKVSYHGVWKMEQDPYCSVETSCGACQSSCTKSYFPDDLSAPLPPASGTNVYRIVTAARANGAYVASRVKANYEPYERN